MVYVLLIQMADCFRFYNSSTYYIYYLIMHKYKRSADVLCCGFLSKLMMPTRDEPAYEKQSVKTFLINYFYFHQKHFLQGVIRCFAYFISYTLYITSVALLFIVTTVLCTRRKKILKPTCPDIKNMAQFHSNIHPPYRRLQLSSHCIENPIYVFPEMKLCCLVPNFYILVSVSDFYIPRIGLPLCLWVIYIFPGSVCLLGSSEIGWPILGIYK
jgi:hypothetical protein